MKITLSKAVQEGKRYITVLKRVLILIIASFISNPFSACTSLFAVAADADKMTRLENVFSEIDTIYKEYAQKHHFPGYSYGVILNGKLVHSGTGGVTDLNTKNPVTTHSMFRIASMTKSFVAMAILKLRDEGKLRLDDPVSLYISEIQNNRLIFDSPQMTIRDLLTHTSGLPYDDPWSDRQLDISDEKFKEILKHGFSFSNPSGMTYEYSSTGFALLGEIIHLVSGIPFEKYINENILKSLGMTDIYWNHADVPACRLVKGYRWVDNKWTEEALLANGAFGAMGGIICSLESFSRYIALHQYAWPPRDEVETGPIRRSSLREMHQPLRFSGLEPKFTYLTGCDCVHSYAYGYGMMWVRDSKGRIFVGHTGCLPGFGCNWFFMPEYGIGVVFFANVTYAQVTALNLQILDKLVVAGQLKPRQQVPSKILQEKHSALIKLFPKWEGAVASGIFADNFFLDRSIDSLKRETEEIFNKAGKIISIEDLVPENQLKGYFLVRCEKGCVRVHFSLNPEVPPLIQQCLITLE